MAKNNGSTNADVIVDEPTLDIEVPEAVKAEVVRVDLAALSAADRKVLTRLFGSVPTSGQARLQTAKRTLSGVCTCGCGEATKSEFTIGHDAKMKSMLKSVVANETPKTPNYKGFTKVTAQKFLIERGW